MKRRMVLGVLVAPLLFLASMIPAHASALESGSWYFDKGNVQSAHDAGYDGDGVTIAVIDGPINPDAPGLEGADLEVRDSYCYDPAGKKLPATSTDFATASHATNVVSMILGTGESESGGQPIRGVAPAAKVLHYAALIPKQLGSTATTEGECLQENGETVGSERPYTGLGKAISDAVDDGADIISVSLSGFVEAADEVAKAHAAGVVVVAAMENEGGTARFPAAYNGVVAVQAFDVNGDISTSTPSSDLTAATPNLSDDVTVAAPGIDLLVQGTATSWTEQRLASGTSLATPIVAGFLAVVKQKYPETSSGQLIDSLIRNTGGDPDHDPVWGNDMGYGAVSLTTMLSVDPTAYPGENPIFDAEDPSAVPSARNVADAAAEVERTPESTPTVPSTGATAGEGYSALPWVVGGFGVVILAAGATTAFLLTRKSRRNENNEMRAGHGR